MSKLVIERTGGLAGFGGKNSHLQSKGEIDINKLSEKDIKSVEQLFKLNTNTGTVGIDSFRYKISRKGINGMESIEANEKDVPDALIKCIKDEIV